jgi:hypothetical protein
MIVSTKKFSPKDYNTLLKIDLDNSSDVFEWRRSFNYLQFESTNFIIENVHQVNDCNNWFSTTIDDSPLIKCSVVSMLRISTKVSFDNIVNNFYKTTLSKDEKDVFLVSSRSMATNLTLILKESDPIDKDTGMFSKGSYSGSAGFWDDEQNLNIDLKVNRECLLDLMNTINNGLLDRVLFNIAVSSFSDEIDDTFRDFDDPQDLLIHGITTPAALESMTIRRKSAVPPENISENISHPDDSKCIDENRNIKSQDAGYLIKDIVFDSPVMRSIKLALWVIAFCLFVLLFK